MTSPVTSSVRTLLGSSGTLKVGWKSSCRERTGGRPVRAAKEGWSKKSGAATRVLALEAVVPAVGGAAVLLQAANSTKHRAPEAPFWRQKYLITGGKHFLAPKAPNRCHFTGNSASRSSIAISLATYDLTGSPSSPPARNRTWLP